MVTTQEVIDAGDEALRVVERSGDVELTASVRRLTECFRRIRAIEDEDSC